MDVGGPLRTLGFGEYEANFRDNKIDENVLPQLTVDGLKDIGRLQQSAIPRRLLGCDRRPIRPNASSNASNSSLKPAPATSLRLVVAPARTGGSAPWFRSSL